MERIWIADPLHILLRPVLIPRRGMSLEAKLNSAMRFALVYAVALLAFGRAKLAAFVAGAAVLLTYGIHRADAAANSEKMAEMERLGVEYDPVTRDLRVAPTAQNPFMNKLTFDPPTRPPAADITRDTVVARAEQAFEGGRCRDVDDVFNRESGSRQFYTMPVTQIPNRQDEYADWLYSSMPPKHNKF